MYVNAKMRPVETSRNGGGGKRRVVEWVTSSMIYLIHCKNFCKCHNAPPYSIIIKKVYAFKALGNTIFNYL
jgi:hypothetical protein